LFIKKDSIMEGEQRTYI